jgi:hypothetical protein
VRIGFENRKVVDPRLHAINPNRKLPVLDDDGTILFESLAIKSLPRGKARQPAEVGECRGSRPLLPVEPLGGDGDRARVAGLG